DITIISDCMSNLHSIALVQEIKLHNKNAKILILAAQLSDFTVIETIKAGVMGFISRTNDFQVLKKALIKIYHNQPYFCDSVSQILARNLTVDDNPSSLKAIFKKLTNREKEIMISLLDGMSINDIANSLHISRKTVTTHKSKVYRKFNITNTIEFVKVGNELGC
ncbi:MAG: response regulator transcription factor, partial [Spirochaetales bacterium]|nr:response regulator transcription factor [Spirochaetales bacterium]